ncbi:MAG TPA: alpha/beta hydrolase [Streptosporangiaceae bacterium]
MTSTSTADAPMTTGSVVSADGTTIAYLRTGTGPGLILLHGSMQSAASHAQLAAALAADFTVYLPDRRGRGRSGPYPAGYSIRHEVQDVEALMAATGATLLFGVSASGLVVLEAARTLPGVTKVAAYEPALLPAGTTRTAWLPRYDREMADGKVAAAMVTSMFGLDLAPAPMRLIPRPVLARLTAIMLRGEDKKAGPGDVTTRALAPTLHYEGALLAEMAGSLGSFASVGAQVLLLGGSKGLAFLRPALDDLARTLPHVRRVELDGLDHGASADVSPANRGGKPAVVAAELRQFFAS